MRDFFLENYSNLNRLVEILPAVFGILFFRKFKNTKIRFLIYFLIYIIFVETVAMYPQWVYDGYLQEFGDLVEGTVFQRNYWWYTIMWNSAAGIFYSLYLSWQLKNPVFKFILRWIRIIFVVSTSIHLTMHWENLFGQASDYAIFFSTGLIIISVVFYFIEILKNDQLVYFHKSINFYMACILLVWFVIITPLKFYNDYYRSADWDYILIQYSIYFAANFIMYIGYALLLIFCNPQPHDA